jgi:tetratricopeptide (TPR) repeat protein
MIHYLAHDYDGALAALRRGLEVDPTAGDKLAMERIVMELGDSGHRYVSPYNVARVYGAIDDKQRALEWLERAYQEHNPDLIELTREPSFESLRSDAKFRQLVERIGWRA